MAFDYPVFLDLGGVPVLLVGAGNVAVRKAQGLAQAGARLTVVAPRHHPGFDQLDVIRHRRTYRTTDLDGQQLVVVATDDPAVNARVAADASAAHIFVNSADDPANCSFILPAVARTGMVTAAISTGGASPALAQRLRDTIAADVLTPAVRAAADTLAAERAAIHAAGDSTEDVDWRPRLSELLDGEGS